MSNKPLITIGESWQVLAANGVKDKVALIGIRGYFLDSMGKKSANDRNMYDDAIVLVSPRKFEAFRANTDPSVYRTGIATMKTGVHRYYKGKHKGRYWALRLVGEQVPVTRDGQSGDKIGIALNIHKGGYRTTGSLGCQTLSPADWDDFIELVYDEMDAFGQKQIPYCLIDEIERRKGAFQMPHISEKENTENFGEKLILEVPAENPIPKPDEPIQKPENSTETKVKVENGDVTVETSENKEPGKTVAVEKPESKGFINTIRTEISALVVGNGGFQAAMDKAEQAKTLGLSSGFWKTLGLLVIVGSVIYLIYRYLDYRSDVKRDLEITNKLIDTNSTPDNQVYLVDSDKIGLLDKGKFEVVRR